MNMKKVDLHMHSNISNDGEYTPDRLMEMCKDAGLEMVALADHNSLSGIPKAKEKAEALGLYFIPAVELDCVLDGINFHLLGYHISDKHNWFRENEKRIFANELAAGSQMMDGVENIGILVDREKVVAVSKDGAITGEMIAEVVLADERNKDNELLMPYRSGGSRSDNPLVNFYWDFCSQGKPAYAKVEYPTFEEAIGEIIKDGGIPVLAHPGANIGCRRDIIEKMKALGLRGIEVYSSYHNKETIAFYNQLADELELMKTIGSDFHGKTKPSIRLGNVDMPERDKDKTIEYMVSI